jgi:cytochrome c peroxidase
MRTVSILITGGVLGVAAWCAAPSVAGAFNDLAPLPKIQQAAGGEIALGKALFFEPRLSGDATISCAKCHQPDKAFGDGAPLSEGYTGARYPSLLNAGHYANYYWDGRIPAKTKEGGSGLEAVIQDHVTQAHFMQADEGLVWQRLREVKAYRLQFQAVYGAEAGMPEVYRALAAFVRSLNTPDAPLDKFLAGDQSALSPEAARGLEVFRGKAACTLCHTGPMLTDDRFHASATKPNPELRADAERRITLRRFLKLQGVPAFATSKSDLGRYAITKAEGDRGRFRTPSLRNVAITAPYMHDGAIGTLEEAAEHYSETMAPGKLTDQEKADLIVFLRSLTGTVPVVEPVKPPPYDGK